MEKEVECQLTLIIKWPELRKTIHCLLDSPATLRSCIQDDISDYCSMAVLLKQESSYDQLHGLSDWLFEKLHDSPLPNKYARFCQIVHEATGQPGLIRLDPGSHEKVFADCLAKCYLGQWKAESGTKNFNLLVSDGLLVSLLATKVLSEDDMAKIYQSGSNKDIALLTTIVKKDSWMHKLVVGLVQADQLVLLELLLPQFQTTFQTEFSRPLSDLRADLSSSASAVRQLARNSLVECLDLYLCIAGSSGEDAGTAVPSVTEKQQQKRPSPPPLASATSEKRTSAAKQPRLDVPEEQPMELQAPSSGACSSGAAATAGRQNLPGGGDSPTSSSAFAEEIAETAGIGVRQMRAYQNELASAGIAGHNSVIVAPTGSGKTLVSISIAAARLAEDPDAAKVCFLADRKHLVEQQFAAFKDQLPERYRHRISCVTGGETERAPLKFCLRENSVLIVSTQILLNSLLDTSEDGLDGDVGKFRLIVFDECHHCDKDHPSKKIMECYFMLKESNPGRRLPQIIGLTASPGTGRANRTDEAKQHLLKLCASLDCRRLVTVRKCLESLGDHVTDPSFRLHSTARKESDAVLECLDQLMDCAERGLLATYQRMGPNGLPRPPMRSSFLYTNFCGELRAKAHGQAGFAYAAEVMIAWRYLHHCNVAQLLRSLFRSADALKYLAEHLGDRNVLDRAPICSLDKELRQQLEQVLPKMHQFVQQQPKAANCSPALEALRKILVEQFTRDPDSRVLVFVQQRCFTTAVKDYLDAETAEALVKAKTGVMTGTNASGDAGGSTQTDQSGLLAAFRRGAVKILISTSVTEEGIDVQKCNAVVRFCHVTNEIAMVQSRGRGRAEGSAYHVIVPDELSWLSQKEQVNRARDEMMQSALRQLSELPEDEFAKSVESVQLEQRADAADKRDIQARNKAANQASAYNLLCRDCGRHLTTSANLRVAQNCHHLALDAELMQSRLELRQEDGVRKFTDYASLGVGLVHKNCGSRIGTLCQYKELVYPEISIGAVVFECQRSGTRHGPLKKWKLVEKFLTVAEISHEDRRAWARHGLEIPANLMQAE